MFTIYFVLHTNSTHAIILTDILALQGLRSALAESSTHLSIEAYRKNALASIFTYVII